MGTGRRAGIGACPALSRHGLGALGADPRPGSGARLRSRSQRAGVDRLVPKSFRRTTDPPPTLAAGLFFVADRTDPARDARWIQAYSPSIFRPYLRLSSGT